MEGGLSRLLLETRKTSDTLSTKTPILSPLNPAIIILVSFVTSWLEIPSFSAKLMTGITRPRRSITPKTWSGRSGILFIYSTLLISWTSEISIANRSPPTVKPINCKTLLTSFCNGISGNLHSLFAVKYLSDLLPQRLCSKWLHQDTSNHRPDLNKSGQSPGLFLIDQNIVNIDELKGPRYIKQRLCMTYKKMPPGG